MSKFDIHKAVVSYGKLMVGYVIKVPQSVFEFRHSIR